MTDGARDGLTRVLARDFDDVLAALPAALKTEGFGVLTEIDMQRTLDQKLGVTFRRYRILGACNPKLAHEALTSDVTVGLSLPCNVIAYEGDDPATTTVMAIDPADTVAAANPALAPVAGEVRAKLARALAALDGGVGHG
ncbi:MAG: DUF302 domain-containing protein [Myxococcales bacterium]|nr:DUF302 domain-containing protein [Myxococcales bacterium]MCB9735099.1 DUF302 domain-containing protein [Deltaproteobacteria bacterium]